MDDEPDETTPTTPNPATLAERILHTRDVDNTGDYCDDLREVAAEVAALEARLCACGGSHYCESEYAVLEAENERLRAAIDAAREKP